jgi:hypothetical protein
MSLRSVHGHDAHPFRPSLDASAPSAAARSVAENARRIRRFIEEACGGGRTSKRSGRKLLAVEPTPA